MKPGRENERIERSPFVALHETKSASRSKIPLYRSASFVTPESPSHYSHSTNNSPIATYAKVMLDKHEQIPISMNSSPDAFRMRSITPRTQNHNMCRQPLPDASGEHHETNSCRSPWADVLPERIPTSLSICPKEKRRRRKQSDLELRYTCIVEGCEKRFALLNSLQQHLKQRHDIDTRVGKGSKRKYFGNLKRNQIERASAPLTPQRVDFEPPRQPLRATKSEHILESGSCTSPIVLDSPIDYPYSTVSTPRAHHVENGAAPMEISGSFLARPAISADYHRFYLSRAHSATHLPEKPHHNNWSSLCPNIMHVPKEEGDGDLSGFLRALDVLLQPDTRKRSSSLDGNVEFGAILKELRSIIY
eukprot:comp24017_c3_seq1/m.42919 comp24017_c3_seq1/g.42919  ORF comp24017_c3_seq1/g.42919 comp24017_c3_seq1/m.42919 type:complete len:362 (-) comp24017_c3_seq1:513-1598(-)